MSHVEPGLPHACLSPQTQHATLFSHATQHYVNLPPSTALSTQRITLTDSQTHTCAHINRQPATPATFPPNQHTFYAAAKPESARSCDCLLWLFVIREKRERRTKKLRFIGQITCGNVCSFQRKAVSAFCSLYYMQQGTLLISEVHFIITTTTAPPTGGQQNSRWACGWVCLKLQMNPQVSVC